MVDGGMGIIFDGLWLWWSWSYLYQKIYLCLILRCGEEGGVVWWWIALPFFFFPRRSHIQFYSTKRERIAAENSIPNRTKILI
jgi:hypothetical protein